MRSLFYSFLGYFLTPSGWCSWRRSIRRWSSFFRSASISCSFCWRRASRSVFWLYAILATIGWIGARRRGTFWIGRQVGEHGLSRFVKPSRLKRVQERVGDSAAVTVAALAIIPPPFPVHGVRSDERRRAA